MTSSIVKNLVKNFINICHLKTPNIEILSIPEEKAFTKIKHSIWSGFIALPSAKVF